MSTVYRITAPDDLGGAFEIRDRASNHGPLDNRANTRPVNVKQATRHPIVSDGDELRGEGSSDSIRKNGTAANPRVPGHSRIFKNVFKSRWRSSSSDRSSKPEPTLPLQDPSRSRHKTLVRLPSMPEFAPPPTILYDFTSAEQRKEALHSVGMVPASLSTPHSHRGAQSCTRSGAANDRARPRRAGSEKSMSEADKIKAAWTGTQTRIVKTYPTARSPSPSRRSSDGLEGSRRTLPSAREANKSSSSSLPRVRTLSSVDYVSKPEVLQPPIDPPSHPSPRSSSPSTLSFTSSSSEDTLGDQDCFQLPPQSRRSSSASFASSVTNAPRQPVAPTMHTRDSIRRLVSLIDDEESRRLTEVAYLC